jgi:CheY-like chemotaxis protein
MSERKLKILYVEDKLYFLEEWLKFIRKTWGEECKGARSREKALQLIAEGFRPDLVILDRGILFHEGEEVDDQEAGDSLYYDLVDRGIPVVVISGNDLEDVEPYCSHPPLRSFSKPVTEEALRLAVDRYFEWLEERR